jgi:hypothetical protein
VALIALNCLFILLLLRIIPRRSHDSISSGEHQRTDVPVSVICLGYEDLADVPKNREIIAVEPDPHLGRCVRNVTWANATRLSSEDTFLFSSDATFEFQHPSSLLFLLSQGAMSGGHLDVVPSSESVPRVLIRVRYHSLHVRDRANVCWMERKSANGTGIGVFVSLYFSTRCQLNKLFRHPPPLTCKHLKTGLILR